MNLANCCHTCLQRALGCNLLILSCHYVDLRVWGLLLCWELYLPPDSCPFPPLVSVSVAFDAHVNIRHSTLRCAHAPGKRSPPLIIAHSHIKDIMVGWKRICLQLCYLDQEAEISLQAEAFWFRFIIQNALDSCLHLMHKNQMHFY